jgi:pimeloyl-ACP methyl ester carboxylesterase
MPTLVVTGDKDGIVAPGYARSLVEALPNAVLETVENAGHYPQIERCEKVVSGLARFAA